MIARECGIIFAGESHDMSYYNAIIHHEEGSYWAEVPALPGCFSSGDTLEQLRENLREAIILHLQGLNSFHVPSGADCMQVAI